MDGDEFEEFSNNLLEDRDFIIEERRNDIETLKDRSMYYWHLIRKVEMGF